MPQTIQDVLSQAQFYSDNRDYAFIKLHPRAIVVAASIAAEVADPFLVMIADKDEVTLLMPAELVEEFEQRLSSAVISAIRYRLITIDVVLEPTLTGFMAHLSRALADEQISILPFAAYSRDHLVVSSEQFERAMNILKGLKP